MANVKCLIVDDEDLARDLIQAHLSQLTGYDVVASCASAIEASQVLKNQTIDLMFLDIEMPVLKGTDFYQNLTNKPKVIFTTAYRDYAIDGFELDAVDYLLKPIVFSRFFKAIEKFSASLKKTDSSLTETSSTINQQREANATKHIFVRKDRKQVKIRLSDILYVQSLKDYIKIFMESGSHIIKQRISAFHDELGHDFLRVHRSYIINKSKITAFTKHDIEIGDIEIPIGDAYRTELHKHLEVC